MKQKRATDEAQTASQKGIISSNSKSSIDKLFQGFNWNILQRCFFREATSEYFANKLVFTYVSKWFKKPFQEIPILLTKLVISVFVSEQINPLTAKPKNSWIHPFSNFPSFF